jgi:hypothetical protein
MMVLVVVFLSLNMPRLVLGIIEVGGFLIRKHAACVSSPE